VPGAIAAPRWAPRAGRAVPGRRARHAEPGQERHAGRGGGPRQGRPRRGRVVRDAGVAGRGRARRGQAARHGRGEREGEGGGRARARKKKAGAGEEEVEGLTTGEDDAAIPGDESVVERREREIARRG
jgi:hypothetical protein